MNAKPEHTSPAEWPESARLHPRTEADLPVGRHQFHKEQLMARIQQERQQTTTAPPRTSKPRRVILVSAMAFALAGAVVAGVTGYGGGSGGGGGEYATGPLLTTHVEAGTAKGAPQLLDRISLAAGDGEHRATLGPGQYVYIESTDASTYVRTDSDTDTSTLVSEKPHRRQMWLSADGTKGWLIDPSVNDSPEGETLSLPDERGNAPVASLNGPSYDYLTGLTTDPDKLLAKIYRETKGMGNTPDQQAFDTIGDLLSQSYPPAPLYSALFRTAAKIPGVVVVKDAEDAAGRKGVAVARLDETSGQRSEWIFNRKTSVFLGMRTVQVKGNGGDEGLIKPGTVTYTSAILTRAIVDGMKQTPTKTG
ncbi:CU044_5270 family protein [Streptomyces sp. NPDC087850]|uniref:CU044_5270 family protein n=1 Tax=Streptomyces sp. NPDC087850 TaxID=3365809 RepID=UPI00382A024E